MDYKIELKPFEGKEGVKYKKLLLTDIQLHTSVMGASSIGKIIKKSLESNQPGRIYTPLEKQDAPNGEFSFTILDLAKNDPVLLKTIQDYEKQGYKVLLEIPDELPVRAGKDTVGFICSVKGKRIFRRLEKDKEIS